MITTIITLLYSAIIKSSLLKYSFFYSCSIQLANMIVPQHSPTQEVVDTIISSVPTKVAGYLGIIYGVAVVLKKISEVWKSYLLDQYLIKAAKQKWEQEELETVKKRKEIENEVTSN